MLEAEIQEISRNFCFTPLLSNKKSAYSQKFLLLKYFFPYIFPSPHFEEFIIMEKMTMKFMYTLVVLFGAMTVANAAAPAAQNADAQDPAVILSAEEAAQANADQAPAAAADQAAPAAK